MKRFYGILRNNKTLSQKTDNGILSFEGNGKELCLSATQSFHDDRESISIRLSASDGINAPEVEFLRLRCVKVKDKEKFLIRISNTDKAIIEFENCL